MLHERILLVRDENAFGDIYNELRLGFEKIEVSVRHIITERVFQEIQKYNTKTDGYKFALVQPKEEEARLNKSKKKKQINADKQVEIALKAFESNGFFLLVDKEQVEELEQIVRIEANTVVSFIKLTPLVGG